MKHFQLFKEELNKNACDLLQAFNEETALTVGNFLGVNWQKVRLEQLVKGMNVEREHADITYGSPFLTAKIALAHLQECAEYYDKLEKIEKTFPKEKIDIYEKDR